MSRAVAIAAFPMYDFPELEVAHAAFWSALRGHLRQQGLADVPQALSREQGHEAAWGHPQLLIGQACEYPLATSAAAVRLVATPRYTAPGCHEATYRSAIVVRVADPATSIADLRGRRCVINERTSNSGMNLLRAAVAPVAHGGRFFDGVEVSGSHRQSIEAVVGGRADVAAIDCVTFALLARADAATLRRLRILDWTPASPSLPLITAAGTSDRTLERLRAALRALAADPAMAYLREQLLLDGFDLQPATDFAVVRGLERAAQSQGYPQLQ